MLPTRNNTEVRSTLAAFLFTGDDVFKKVADLSGGERGRLSLAKLMLSKSNFLILDEPTNHLDIISKEILEDAVSRYEGTVLCVSHDRYFINHIATRILDLTNRTLVSYMGDYDYYLERREELTETFASDTGKTHSSGGVIAASNRQHLSMQHVSEAESAGRGDWKKQKEAAAAERKKASLLKKTEEEIARLEERSAAIDEEISREEIYTDPEKLRALSEEKGELTEKLEKLYEDWSSLAE